MLSKDLGRLDQCHLRRHGAVGPDLQSQPVVVGLLADSGLFNLILHAGDRAEHRIDRNDSDLLRDLAVLA